MLERTFALNVNLGFSYVNEFVFPKPNLLPHKTKQSLFPAILSLTSAKNIQTILSEMERQHCPCEICFELSQIMSFRASTCEPVESGTKTSTSLVIENPSSDYAMNGSADKNPNLKTLERGSRPGMHRRCSVTKFNLFDPTQDLEIAEITKHVDSWNSNEEFNQLLTRSRGNRPQIQRRCSVTKFNLSDVSDDSRRDEELQIESEGFERLCPQLESRDRGGRPLMRRRCSVTKFNLDEVKVSSRRNDEPPFQLKTHSKVVRRPPLQRRCSVTKFSFDSPVDESDYKMSPFKKRPHNLSETLPNPSHRATPKEPRPRFERSSHASILSLVEVLERVEKNPETKCCNLILKRSSSVRKGLAGRAA